MKRQRVSSACRRCRQRKLGCNDARPCQPCIRAGLPCDSEDGVEQSGAGSRLFSDEATGTSSHHTKAHLLEFTVVDLARQMLSDVTDHQIQTSALPGGLYRGKGDNESNSLPQISGKLWTSLIDTTLPPTNVLEILIATFFSKVDWFMMTIPRTLFHERCHQLFTSEVVLPEEENFAWLVLTILMMASFYGISDESSMPLSSVELKQLALTLLQKLDQTFIQILNSSDVEAVQICILLGSFHLFNGRPNSGFGILGAAIKLAQNLGLHRRIPLHTHPIYVAHSWTRTWLTLEVFDKYSAVAFGRQCAIDDSDCDVEFSEVEPDKEKSPYYFTILGEDATLLSFHRQKFMLYRIMGPFLGRRIQTNRLESLSAVHNKLIHWSATLPNHLRLSYINRATATSSASMIQIAKLQAVSLQLAYDNLQISLHRWVLHENSSGSTTGRRSDSQLSKSQLIDSALRIASLGSPENVDTLRQCQSTHAAMHVGLCIFSAGVVLCAIAMQDPLSNQAHQAKGGIRSIIQMYRRGVVQNHVLTAQSVDFLEHLVDRLVVTDRDMLLGKDTATIYSVNESSVHDLLSQIPDGHGTFLQEQWQPQPGLLLDEFEQISTTQQPLEPQTLWSISSELQDATENWNAPESNALLHRVDSGGFEMSHMQRQGAEVDERRSV